MTATTFDETPAERRDGVSWRRLLWVGPLTVVVALVVNLIIKTLVQALDPSLTEMGQLGRSLIILTLEGAILAVLVFALIAWLVPRPIRWFRLVAVMALLLSLIPDLLLGLGGDARRMGSAMVAPFSRFGAMFFPAEQGGGREIRGHETTPMPQGRAAPTARPRRRIRRRTADGSCTTTERWRSVMRRDST